MNKQVLRILEMHNLPINKSVGIFVNAKTEELSERQNKAELAVLFSWQPRYKGVERDITSFTTKAEIISEVAVFGEGLHPLSSQLKRAVSELPLLSVQPAVVGRTKQGILHW